MAASPRSITGRRAAASSKRTGQVIQRISELFDEHRAQALISVGAEGGGNIRRFSIQVVDRLGEPYRFRWRVLVKVATTAGGDPGGTQAVTVATGALLQTIIANKLVMALSDADGLIEVDVAVVGAETRYVAVEVVGKFDTESEAASWA
jgi:hypothetical protein